jgi:hypothetical protein
MEKMKGKRERYSSSFKAKVAIEAIKERELTGAVDSI